MSLRKTLSFIFCLCMVAVCITCFPQKSAALISDSSTVIKMPEDVPSGKYDGRYTGAEKNGAPNGSGTVVFPFGKYIGEFANGYPNGSGTYYFSDGTEVCGYFTWVENKHSYLEAPLSGNSPTYSGTGMSYTGMSLNGSSCGYGCLDFDSGGSFYGEFQNGDLSGPGTYCYMNSARSPITGTNWNLVNRLPSNLGGRWYSGLRQNMTWQGFGMLCYNYSYYVGEVLDCLCCGYGEYWQWQTSGDPSGTLSLKESGTYSGGERISSGKPASPSSASSGSDSFLPIHGFGTEKMCDYCNGTGNCKYCDGLGYRQCPSSNCTAGRCNKCIGGTIYKGTKTYTCSACHGDGICNTCFGSGTRQCSICYGDGKCNICYGRGYR